MAGILYCFRIAVILEKGIVGYGRMLEPLAQAGELGATAAALLLPDRLTLHIVEFVGRLM
ncbi:hypothetical protein [Meinhardsimonia xiamenensis]|uniref:hypothetical protein n=1 Tax=Meinhardsimonia xiamenensis TaxID=990712 RepID=UPI001473E313|nr:hypothetical protein [Meinhardsimonia xiamenensis]